MEKLKLGLIVNGMNYKEGFEKVVSLNIPTCQLTFRAEDALSNIDPVKVKISAENSGIEITAIFFGFKGQKYNLKDGPETMGLVAVKYRKERLEIAKEFSDFIKELDINYICSHVGFIPDDELDPVYTSFIPVMKEFVSHCKDNGQIFCFETGQELPSTLKRTIIDIGLENIGINLDPANLILYGKANPLDAIEIFGKYIMSMHAKDGLWPNREELLVIEVPIGEGIVNFPILFRRLKKIGYKSPITIEREISGEKQIEDIKKSIDYLTPFL